MATWTSNGLDIGGANPSLSVSFILANNAHTGDTIIIPAGYYTWQTGVTISIGVTLLGQGSVFITCNGGGVGAGNAATATIITANSGTDGHIHIQNIQFYIITTATAGHYPINAGRSLSSSTNPFTVIIQNCVFNNAQIYTYAILTLSNGIIISGCTFIGSGDNGNAGINFQCVAYENASPAPPAYWNYPDTMGATPTQYGTGDVQTFAAPAGLNNIYVEDCVAYDCSVASNNGDDHARIVYRHNSHYNATIFYTHGQDSSTYGPRHWEIYNNTANGNATNWTFATSFTQPAPGSSVTITLNNTTNMIPMVCIGLYNIYTVSNITSNQVTLKNVGWPLSSATGATISAGTIYGPSGSGGGTFPYNWNGWIFHRGGTGIIFNNTAPTLASIMGFPRAPIVFTVQQINRTGQFSCQTAYPANRQIGIGWSAGSSTPYGHPSVPSDGVGQVVNPIYIWGNSNAFANTSADVSLDQFTPDQCGNGQIVGTYLQSGRDYLPGTAMSGWTAYTYPHPLAASGGTPPTVSLTAPAAGNVSGTVTVSATAAATAPATISNVQFTLNGANIGAADTTSPYSIAWVSSTVPNSSYTLAAVATDSTSLSTTSSGVAVNVSNPLPTVSITAPSSGTVSGTITVSATAAATAPATIANVQFKLDGVNLGALDTVSPYSISWDTTTSSNVSHTLTAVATDTSGNSKTSSGVSITVSNATDTTAPSVPTGLSVDTPTFNSLTVHWSASTDIDNAQNTLTYVLQRSTGVGNTTFSTIFTRPADAPAAAVNPIAYVDNTLAAGTTYNYKVQALDPSSNPSGFTATQTLATFAGPPAFVQSNASQSSSVTTGSCAFNSAQTVGHYNVVVISVTSAAPVTITGGVPTDQAGHVYTLLSGPTSIGTLTQWIFGSNI